MPKVDTPGSTGLSQAPLSDDEKAKLLKDLMRWKDTAKKTEAGKTEAEKKHAERMERLGKALGVESVDDLEAKISEIEKNEEERLRAAGEFEKLRERMTSQHQKELQKIQGERDQKIGDLTKKVEAAESEIRRLLVSNTFAGSQFLADELTLSATHAERLFGDNFKVEEKDGRRVVTAYLNGEPLVDSSGNPLGFDDALREIVNGDPDKDRLFRPKAKPGAGSGAKGQTTEPPKPDNLKGRARIASALTQK